MNTKKHHWILYAISFTILATIAVQVFWNYKNYEQNKQRVLNEIQISLDTAIEEYFADITKNSTITFVDMSGDSLMSKEKALAFFEKINFDTIFKPTSSKKIKSPKIGFEYFENIKPNSISSISIFKGKEADSISHLKGFTNKIVISISQDSIEFNKLNPYFEKQLNRKHLSLPFGFVHYKGNTIKGKYSSENATWKGDVQMFSKSTYLKSNEKLELLINNPSKEALKRSLTGIFLSLLLSSAIISCLFYLLHIINKQKELAEIKNDLISNITHEFKTPITTVSAAIEAIRSFNTINDQEKTEKYLSISTSQLKKLTIMVEKLLETATLDSEQLLLKKENIDIIALVQKVALKEEFSTAKKNITFNTSVKEVSVNIDSFHFENAISNLIDNAIKYGGNNIEVHISTVLNTLEISVVDDGKPIEKNQREKIFDQFYRIPKGNTHDVKGFGIGLYYTKKIIEKHDGQISLIPNTAYTIFKISMPL